MPKGEAMLALSDAEVNALAITIAALLSTPGGVKIVSWIRSVIRLRHEVDELRAAQKEQRGLIDVLADELSMMELERIGVLESQDAALFVIDLSGRTKYISPALARMYGFGQDDSMNGAFLDAVRSDERPRITQEWADFLKSNRRTVLLKYQFTTQAGLKLKVRLRLVRKHSLHDGVGRIIGYLTEDHDAPGTDKSSAVQNTQG